MAEPIVITADEINCLIHSYLEDSGFQHSAFAIRMEGRLEYSPHFRKHIPRGELVELLSKALLYVEVEAHWKADSMTANCKTGFSLLEPHVCALEPPAKPNFVPPIATVAPEHAKTNGSIDPASKRKADTPSTDGGRSEKRQKREGDDTEMDVAAARVESAKPSPAPAHPPSEDSSSKQAKSQKISRPPTMSPADQLAVSLLKGHKREVFNCAWNPAKAKLLATGSKDAIVNIWEIPEPAKNTPLVCGPPVTISDFSKDDDADITAMHWSPDGSLLAIASYDKILRVYTHSGKPQFSTSIHNGPIFAVRFSADSRWLLSASLDGLVCIWKIQQKQIFRKWQCHRDCVLDLDWLDDTTFATCGSDGLIHIMRISEAEPIKTLSGHAEGIDVNQIAVNSSGTRLASCSDDQTLRVWNVSKSNLLNRSPDSIPGLQSSERDVVMTGHTGSVCGVSWCSHVPPGSNELIATASFDKTVRLWDSVTGECLKIFTDHKRAVYTLTFSPDGRWLASGGGDGALHIYDVKNRKKVWTWRAGTERPGIYEVVWQQSGKFDRIALALENFSVGLVDANRISALRESSAS